MLQFRRSRHQLAVLHPFGRYQFTRNLVHLIATSADDNHLQTIMLVQMNVQAGIHCNLGFVLHIGENITESLDPMVVEQGDHADDLSVSLADALLDQMISNQIANCFRAVLVAQAVDAMIESTQKIFFERNAKARKMVHWILLIRRVTRFFYLCQASFEAGDAGEAKSVSWHRRLRVILEQWTA